MSATGNAWARHGAVGRFRTIVPMLPLARLRDGDWWKQQWAVEADARTAFHILPLGLMLGILLVHGAGLRPPALVVLLFAGAAFVGGCICARPVPRSVYLLTGFLFLGMTAAALEISRTKTVVVSGETTTRVQGRVLWRDKDERGRWRYLLALEATTRPTLSRPPTQAKVLVSSRHEPLAIGATYRGLVRLRPPSGPALPGGYDFAKGAFFEGVGAQGFGLGPPDASPQEISDLTPSERLTRLRLAISDRIRETVGGAEGAVASAIITGERSGIPDDVDGWLRTTGLSHVLSISGLHMALVAGFMMLLVRSAIAAVPVLALHLSAKKVAAGAAFAGSAFYWAMSGMDVATTRSFVMIAIMLAAVILDRAAITLRNVSIAALVILLTTPHALLTASFQMSFAATAAIVAVYGFHARRRSASDERRRRGPVAIALFSLAGIAITSLVAGLATGPYSAFHFQRIAPFGLLANMLTLPLFSLWIMPLALLAMIAMPFGFDGPLLYLLGKGLSLVFSIAHFLADRLLDEPIGLLTLSGLLVLTVALLTACFLASALRLVAVPLTLLGLAIVPDRSERPDILLFESGREMALIDTAGRLQFLNPRPNAFVGEQWARAYPHGKTEGIKQSTAFSCETIAAPEPVQTSRPTTSKPRAMRYCSATTRNGLRIVWTDDYRRTGQACDEANIVIVARALRRDDCRSGAHLFTLRNLRGTGSIAIYGDSAGSDARIVTAMSGAPTEWNGHREAPWPERWSRAEDAQKPQPPSVEP